LKEILKMKIILLSLVFFTILSCAENNSKKYSENSNTISKSEISNILVYFSSTSPSDGEWNSEFSNETKEKVECKLVKDDKIFWCYDVQNLLKIEILGNVSNASIDHISANSEIKTIISEIDIRGQFTIAPSEVNDHLSGGKIVIKSNNEVLKEIQIQYEGCL